jgi:adenylyl-sulfate kinase
MSHKQALIFWFTGLSGAGKTTIAQKVYDQLVAQTLEVLLLDGDDVRERFHTHLGFSEADIKENNALLAQLCIEHRDKYDVIMVPIISPYLSSRRDARKQIGDGFFEVFIHADLDTVVDRDTKGMYAKAKRGEFDNLIGVSPKSPYQPPENADFTANTTQEDVIKSVRRLTDFVLHKIR